MSEDNTQFQLARAVSDFHEARRKAMLEGILAPLRGKSAELFSYDEIRQKLRTIESARRTLEEIPLDKIVGSVNRYTDFTRSFLPRNESDVTRWARVKLGVEQMMGLPPIEVYKVGEVYFVLDGHHRVSVAREIGAKTIEAYVTPVYIRVPLSLGDSPDDLILKSEYDHFLDKTHLDDLRPQANLQVTAPGQYQQILEHISVHRYFMGEARHQEVPYPEAVKDWYDNVYKPVADLIREHNLLRDFPGRTEADLYLWIMDHRAAIAGGDLGWEIPPERAAADLVNNYSPIPSRRWPRIAHRLISFLIPDTFSSGPPPGSWRNEHQSPRRADHLLDDILVAIPGGKGDWPAVRMAIEVARREEARLTGIHVMANEAERGSAEMKALEEEFLRHCAEARVAGRMIFETGQVAQKLSQRSPWTDLIVFRLNYPPPPRVLKRLRSGVRMLIRQSSSPLLAVPDAPFHLGSALLAYGPGPKADEALFIATYLAGRWGIPLTVVTVKRGDQAQADGNTAPQDQPEAGQLPDGPGAPSALMERARIYLETHGVQATCIEESGDAARDPAQAVLINAEAHNADFIIMGGYESGALREAFFGSTVDRVLRSTRRPTLICR